MSTKLFINPYQKFALNCASSFTYPMRFAIQKCEEATRQGSSLIDRTFKVVIAFFVGSVGLLCLPFAGGCYFSASSLGPGRLEFIEKNQTNSSQKNRLRIAFMNLCAQHPWSAWTGGVRHPSEKLLSGETRMETLAKKIAHYKPDLLF